MTITSRVDVPVIALLTDFGLLDSYVGVMKGVILKIVPHVHLIDITHAIPPQQIAEGAWALGTSYRYFPDGTIFLCVVDPGVGSTRRPIALQAGNWYFVGPDNGLCSPLLHEQPVHSAIALTNSAYHLPQVSSTFHGRDIFAPIAAQIAAGRPLPDLGSSLEPTSLQRLAGGSATRQGERVEGRIVHIDHFGNLISDIPVRLLPDFFTVASMQAHIPARNHTISERRRTFASTQDEVHHLPFCYLDSAGVLGIAIQNGNAAHILEGEVGLKVIIELNV